MVIVCLHTKPPAAQHQKVNQEVINQGRETVSPYCQKEKSSLHSSLVAPSLASPRDSVSIHTAFFVLLTLHLKDRAARDPLALSCSW